MPKSWNLDLEGVPSVVQLPAIDLETIVKEDSINDLDKSMPWRYGIERFVNLDIQSDGLWTTLPDGGKIWQAAIHSTDALNLSVVFDDFFMPAGSRLHLFNSDHTDVTATYSGTQNREEARLGTWFVEGDLIWIEYYQPPGMQDEPRLHINSVIHGYRMGKVNSLVRGERSFEGSGDCNYDVNCPLGNEFDAKKDVVKKAVALLNLGNGYLCSAALINTALNNKIPYLLTANHCLDNSDPALWTVRFNWVSPTPVCGTGEGSGNVETNFTISGAQLRANNPQSDFALVELFEPIPDSWDVAFAGWDNSDTDPIFEVGIHHPNGDIMKMCYDDSGAQKIDANGTQVWLIGGGSHGYGNGWEMGTTESGSSGSPLFNENGKIIGQLYAGESQCIGTETNHDYDIYGRFGVSWNGGNSPETRLKDWLDPTGIGVSSVETLQNVLNVPDFQHLGKLKVYPNPASSVITVMNNRYPQLTYVFTNAVGQHIKSGSLSNTMNSISVDNLAEGVYFLRLTDGESQDSVTKKILIQK